MKQRMVVSLLLAIALLTACGGGKGIYGTVTDGEARKSLAGASVELLSCAASGCDEKVASQTTSSDGRYSFPDVPAGKYMLSIIWGNAPLCPGIQPYQTLGTSGEFLVTYAGYGGLGGTGNRRMVAVKELELQEGKSVKLDLTFACPK
jgi:hypothetical protein